MKYFLLWEIILYSFFMTGDLWDMPWSSFTNSMKYLAMISCAIYVWFCNNEDEKGKPLQFALLYSVCADYFMLFTEQIWLGIVGFCCVQICYWIAFKKICSHNQIQSQNGVIWTGIVFLFAIISLIMTKIYRSTMWKEIQSLFIIISAIGYIGLSVGNFIRMGYFFNKISSRNNWNIKNFQIHYSVKEKESAIMLFMGTFLLLVGDIYVGLNQIMPVVGPAMWFFYLPSQVCIAMASKMIA